MKYSAIDVAKYVIKEYGNRGEGVSNLKLQKILYYAEMKSLKETGCALFCDPFEAWRHGPVISSLYANFKKYMSDSIDLKDDVFNNCIELSECDKKVVNCVIDKTFNVDPWCLVDKTHETSPWVDNYVPGYNYQIPKDEIKNGEFNI